MNLAWAHDPIRKSTLDKRSTLQKHVTSMSCELEPTVWSHDTGQHIPCFDRCQLIIVWMSKAVSLCQPIWSMAALLGNSIVATVVVVRMRPWAIPLAMITMKKSTHGFLFFPIWVWGSAIMCSLQSVENCTKFRIETNQSTNGKVFLEVCNASHCWVFNFVKKHCSYSSMVYFVLVYLFFSSPTPDGVNICN